ncbi:MAG TPA: hypothetical protein GX702_09435 [Chloroflexi bacterium]|jgi:hypothetical protein|nr:hypothetical protein [Chloroflexota bacterium]
MKKSLAQRNRILLWVLSVVIAGSMLCSIIVAILPAPKPAPVTTPAPAVVWPTSTPTPETTTP